jgi:hypothetical protein
MIPKVIKSLLWEFDEVDIEKNGDLVMERVLEMGDSDQVKWMLEQYPKNRIVGVLEDSKIISLKSANYWAKYFNCLPNTIKCLRMQSPSKQNRFS